MDAALDTNHYVALTAGGPMSSALKYRALALDVDFVITIITPQEIVQGWLAAINHDAPGPPQVYHYQRFQRSLAGFSLVDIVPFDEASADIFLSLQRQRLRVGTMDLKIAAICLANDVLLLTGNRVDFDKVPGLRVENWLD